MSIPLQFVFLFDGQEVFVWSNCLLDLGKDFLFGNMVVVRDAWYLAAAPHFHGLCYYERFFNPDAALAAIQRVKAKWPATHPGMITVGRPDSILV